MVCRIVIAAVLSTVAGEVVRAHRAAATATGSKCCCSGPGGASAEECAGRGAGHWWHPDDQRCCKMRPGLAATFGRCGGKYPVAPGRAYCERLEAQRAMPPPPPPA